MTWTREPAVAGLFYPAGESALRDEVDGFLRTASQRWRQQEGGEKERDGDDPVKALIAPHAGYPYSGPVAASAYVRLGSREKTIGRVILLGPAHRYSFRGVAACSARGFETPLGEVEEDGEAVAEILDQPQVQILDDAHRGEHSLEVHLPFIQRTLADVRIVPLVVGIATPEEVEAVLRALWGGPETLVVVSSDLSHYLSYEEAVALDEETARAVEALRPEDIGAKQACGRTPVGGLLLRAREEGMSVERVDLRNSGDTAGDRDRVVGYGSFLFR